MSVRACVPLAALTFVGCAIRHEDADPVETFITVEFPSQQAAIAVDTIELRVYPAGGSATKCAELLQMRRDGTGDPTPALSQTNNICEYFRGSVRIPQAVKDVETPVLSLGDVAILAIASLPDGQEAFSGCMQQVLGAADAALLPISLSRSNPDVAVSAGSCPSLEQLCSTAGCSQ